jgi:hypothetical protein
LEVEGEQLFGDVPKSTLSQMIEFVGSHNVREIWTIKVGNSLDIKHYILLLQNRGYLCSCLSIIQCGIVCRHYFQVMLVTKMAFFHIRFISSRWYDDNKISISAIQEPFLVSDKFSQDDITYNYDDFIDSNTSLCLLCLFNQNNSEFCEERLTVIEQKLIYGKLHEIYKKALNKALQSNSKSQQLINLLQEFTEDRDSDSDESYDINQEDEIYGKENLDPSVPTLQNPKKHCDKGRPLGTKRFRSSTEVSKPKQKNQRHCKKCGKVGHYQKNCKVGCKNSSCEFLNFCFFTDCFLLNSRNKIYDSICNLLVCVIEMTCNIFYLMYNV